MLPIPVGTRHTVTFTANVWKPIRCEQCGCEFAYRIELSTSGRSTNYLWLNRQGAIDLARMQASNEARQVIETSKKAYPCPDCGIYQGDMANDLKTEKTTEIRLIGLVIALILVFTLSLIVEENLAGKVGDFITITAYILSILIGLTAAYWFVRSRLPFDPNAQFGSRAGQSFSKEYPVLRRADLDALATKNWAGDKTPNLVLPWPASQ